MGKSWFTGLILYVIVSIATARARGLVHTWKRNRIFKKRCVIVVIFVRRHLTFTEAVSSVRTLHTGEINERLKIPTERNLLSFS